MPPLIRARRRGRRWHKAAHGEDPRVGWRERRAAMKETPQSLQSMSGHADRCDPCLSALVK
jgi:hypothetical protein